jgi:hypothetical protein
MYFSVTGLFRFPIIFSDLSPIEAIPDPKKRGEGWGCLFFGELWTVDGFRSGAQCSA